MISIVHLIFILCVFINFTYIWCNSTTSSSDLKLKIVKGKIAPIDKFPYSAALKHNCIEAGLAVSCTGAIITHTVILTAGHCVIECVQPENPHFRMDAYVGNANKRIGTHYKVKEYFIHPDFGWTANETHQINDLALEVLGEMMEFSNNVKPIKFATTIEMNHQYAIAGWGRSSLDADSSSSVLYYTHMTTFPCNETNMICTKATKKDSFSYKGDSGAAFINSKGKLCGINSYGLFDKEGYKLSVMVDITKYKYWIHHTIGMIKQNSVFFSD